MKITEQKIYGRHVLFVDAEDRHDETILDRIGSRGSRLEGQIPYASTGDYLTIEVWQKPE